MLQNPCKTLGFKQNKFYKIPPRGGRGEPYPASGLHGGESCDTIKKWLILVKPQIRLSLIFPLILIRFPSDLKQISRINATCP